MYFVLHQNFRGQTRNTRMMDCMQSKQIEDEESDNPSWIICCLHCCMNTKFHTYEHSEDIIGRIGATFLTLHVI